MLKGHCPEQTHTATRSVGTQAQVRCLQVGKRHIAAHCDCGGRCLQWQCEMSETAAPHLQSSFRLSHQPKIRFGSGLAHALHVLAFESNALPRAAVLFSSLGLKERCRRARPHSIDTAQHSAPGSAPSCSDPGWQIVAWNDTVQIHFEAKQLQNLMQKAAYNVVQWCRQPFSSLFCNFLSINPVQSLLSGLHQ